MKNACEIPEMLHEMGTLLALLTLNAQLLRACPEISSGARRYANDVETTSEKIARLYRSAMRISLMGDEAPMRMREENLAVLIERALETLRPLAATRAVRICYTPQAPHQSLLCNAPMIERIFYNLIDNAIKYTPRGGKIDIRTWEEDECTFFSVRDEGSGIPEEALPCLFSRGFTVSDRAPDGTESHGVGLYLAQRCAYAHGGYVKAENVAHGGALFTVCLPKRAASDTPVRAEA